MPGYLTADQIAEARSASDAAFDVVFVRLMSQHHAGAVRMAYVEWHSAGDPRLRVIAHAIRHEQQGEIALMNGSTGSKPFDKRPATCSRITFKPSKIRRPRCEGTKRLLASLIGDEASIPERFQRDRGCFDRPAERRRSWTEPPR